MKESLSYPTYAAALMRKAKQGKTPPPKFAA